MIIKAIQTGLLVGGMFGGVVFVLALPFVFFDELYNALEKGGKHGVFGLLAIAFYVFFVLGIFTFSIYLATGGK